MNEILTCEGLSKRYGKGQTALDGVELHLEPGRIVGLLGPNGSGKTTLIKLANGLLQPSAGTVKIAGMSPRPGDKGAGVLPAGCSVSAGSDAGGTAGGDVPGFLCGF